LQTANALWFILEKMTKIADHTFGNCGSQKLGWKCEFTVLNRFSQEKERFLTPSSQTSLNCLERRSKTRKKRNNIIRGRI
jgi:hypothetical protein